MLTKCLAARLFPYCGRHRETSPCGESSKAPSGLVIARPWHHHWRYDRSKSGADRFQSFRCQIYEMQGLLSCRRR